MDSDLKIRFATEEDIPEILRLIKLLAAYEKAEDEAVATYESLHEWLFERKTVEALIIEHPEEGVVGCAVFFTNFSTWTGRGGIYLEDLFIEERHRGGGIGHKVMARLASICVERGYPRMDWVCLDWNTPSLGFYQKIGADAKSEWIHHRLDGEALATLAREATV